MFVLFVEEGSAEDGCRSAVHRLSSLAEIHPLGKGVMDILWRAKKNEAALTRKYKSLYV